MLVRPNLITVRHASVEDELCVGSIILCASSISLLRPVGSLEGQQESLDDMISIGMGRHLKDILSHFDSDGKDL